MIEHLCIISSCIASFTCFFCYCVNGLNFSEGSEQVNFHLGALDLDLALLEDKPAAISDSSSED